MPKMFDVASFSEVLNLFEKFYKSFGITIIFSLIAAVAFHVLQGFALKRMAKGLGISRDWLAFVPIANMYFLGLVAEKYMVGGKKIPKYSKILYLLLIVEVFLTLLFLILTLSFLILMLKNIETAINNNQQLTPDMFSNFVPVIVVYFILLAISIVYNVYKNIALWRIYGMYIHNKKYEVAFLILSIICTFASSLILFSFSKRQPVFKEAPEEKALFNLEGE